MAGSSDIPAKRARLSEEGGEECVKECTVTGICLNNFSGEKRQLLLPTIYPLNHSRSKYVICGLKLNYLTNEVEPTVGIIDQYNKGIVLSGEMWKCLTESFGNIQDFFDCANYKKWSELLHKPIEHPGFSINLSYIPCGYTKSKVVGFSTGKNQPGEESKTYRDDLTTMQLLTFNTLREIGPIITEYLIFLQSVIPCVKECITCMIDFGRDSIEKQNISNFLDKMNKEVVKQIARNSLNDSECASEVAKKINETNNEMYGANYKRIVRELYVYHSHFLIYYMFNPLALSE